MSEEIQKGGDWSREKKASAKRHPRNDLIPLTHELKESGIKPSGQKKQEKSKPRGGMARPRAEVNANVTGSPLIGKIRGLGHLGSPRV